MITTPKSHIRDQFDIPTSNWRMDESFESSGLVDGKSVLARMVGESFLIDGASRNRRWYSRRLWESAIAKVKTAMERGGLIGTIGHDQPLDENAILSGKVSHKVTRAWIDEDNQVGMTEILILNTPAGQILNTLLRSGCQIPVSSRGLGVIAGKTAMGEDIIDPDSFILETWDFVINPGVETAYPKLVESLVATVNKEEKKMDEMSEKLIKEKIQIQSSLDESLTENKTLRLELQLAENKNDKLKKVVEYYRNSVGDLNQVKSLVEGFSKFMLLKPFQKLAKDLNLDKIPGLGSKVFALSESLTETGVELVGNVSEEKALLETYKKFGSPAKLKGFLEALVEYRKLGSLKEVKQSTVILEELAKFGTVKDVSKLCDVAEAYAKLGTPKQIKEKFEAHKVLEGKILAARKSSAAKKISEKMEVPVETVSALLEKMTAKEAIALLKPMQESNELVSRLRVVEGSNKETKPAPRGKSAPQSIAESVLRGMVRNEGSNDQKFSRM